MEEQPSPTTQMPSAQQRYRVRRRRTEPLDSHVSSADAAPKMRIRVRSGEYSVVGAVSSPAQDSTASGIPIGVAGEALNVSNPAADVEDCDRTLEADEQSVAPAFCTPRTLSEDMNSAGLDGVQVIDFAYKLVATKQVLRASSFDAAPEVCADGHSLPIASNFSRSNAQEMMISNESVPDCPESLADLTTSRSTQLAMEVSNMEQRPDEVANEPNQSFQGRALIKDGVRIIDFAYAYAAMSPKQSPKRGKGRARFASRSENAPSVHHKSTSKDVRVSTASANNIVDLEASQPERITTGLRFKDEVRGSPQNSNEDGLLLLQFSVYTPPDQAEPSGSQGSDGASMTILPSSVYTPPDTVQGNDDQEADDTLTLKLLPASVYTRPDPMERWHGADVEGLLITDSYRADAASPYVRKQDSSASQIEAGGLSIATRQARKICCFFLVRRILQMRSILILCKDLKTNRPTRILVPKKSFMKILSIVDSQARQSRQGQQQRLLLQRLIPSRASTAIPLIFKHLQHKHISKLHLGMMKQKIAYTRSLPLIGVALWVACWGFSFRGSAEADMMRLKMNCSRGSRSARGRSFARSVGMVVMDTELVDL